MDLQFHTPFVERYTHRILDLQQTASICLITRDTSSCSGMIDRRSALDRLIHGWSPQHLFGTPCFHLIDRAVHMVASRHVTHMLELLLPWTPVVS
jgi:hypothetical protein